MINPNINTIKSKYITDYYNIKQYNHNMYKLTYSKMPIKRKGYDLGDIKKVRRDVNDIKLSNNVVRAKMKVFEYSMCNTFDDFVTLTLNQEKYDRHNLSKYIKDLGQFIRNYRRDYNVNIQYLLIPEQHKNGAWHMHGLFKGIPLEHLTKFKVTDNIPQKLKNLILAGRYIYNWQAYGVKFGWVTVEKIISQERVSKYITKYIKKSFDMGQGVTEKNKRLYYPSKGLLLPERIKEGSLTSSQLDKITFDYDNEYIKSKMLNGLEYQKLDNEILLTK